MRRQLVLGEFFGAGVERRDLVAAIFGHDDAVLVVDIHAARAGVLRGHRPPFDLGRLGVDLADVPSLELGHPEIVLRV